MCAQQRNQTVEERLEVGVEMLAQIFGQRDDKSVFWVKWLWGIPVSVCDRRLSRIIENLLEQRLQRQRRSVCQCGQKTLNHMLTFVQQLR